MIGNWFALLEGVERHLPLVLVVRGGQVPRDEVDVIVTEHVELIPYMDRAQEDIRSTNNSVWGFVLASKKYHSYGPYVRFEF